MIALIAGAVLAGIAVALALRAAALGRARGRGTLDQIAAYGFAGGATGAGSGEGGGAGRRPQLLPRLADAVGAATVSRLGEERRRDLQALLRAAGLYRTSVVAFLGWRALGAAGLPLLLLWLLGVAGALGWRSVALALCAGMLAWTLPLAVVRRRARERQRRIDREVPELVDLLVTSVEAGVGFAAALQLAARRVQGPLGEELRVALAEQRMGLSLEEALRNLLARADSASLRAFVQAVLQGEGLGVSIGRILRDLAVDIRKRRRQEAEERAQKSTLKILFPLVALIFPALFIVSLGPLVISFLHGLAN